MKKEIYPESDERYVKTEIITDDNNDPIKWLHDICGFLNEVGPCFMKVKISDNKCTITYRASRYEDKDGNPTHIDSES